MRTRIGRAGVVLAFGIMSSSSVAHIPADVGVTTLGLVTLRVYHNIGGNPGPPPIVRNQSGERIDRRAPVLRIIAEQDGRDRRWVISGIPEYEQLIYGGVVADADREHWLLGRLDRAILEADVEHRLTAAESRRLRVMGFGDIRRFVERVASGRPRGETPIAEPGARLGLALRGSEFHPTFERGPFGEGSLFAKTLAKILADREAVGAKDDRD